MVLFVTQRLRGLLFTGLNLSNTGSVNVALTKQAEQFSIQ